MHDIVLWVKAADNCREVFIDPPAEVVAEKGTSIGMMHNKVAQ
jgi:hypothetical protein